MMIKFTVKGESGEPHMIGMGLSHGNLDYLKEGKPIAFDAATLKLDLKGLIVVCVENEEYRQHAAELQQHTRLLFVFTAEELDRLRGEDVVFGLPDDNLIVLFHAGKTEEVIYEEIKHRIGPETSFQWRDGFPPDRSWQSLN